eukprot:1056978-Pleurochrysis_carterae.AAC.1
MAVAIHSLYCNTTSDDLECGALRDKDNSFQSSFFLPARMDGLYLSVISRCHLTLLYCIVNALGTTAIPAKRKPQGHPLCPVGSQNFGNTNGLPLVPSGISSIRDTRREYERLGLASI